MSTSVTGPSASELLEIDAEIQRLGKLLGVDPAELAYLRGVSSLELRELRGQVTATLFDGPSVLGRFAAATRLLPASLVANVAQRAFGPMLAARIAGLVDPDRAVEIALRLPVPFLADVATELDPRRVNNILGEIPPATVAEVTRLLVSRREWVAMGTFYGYLPDASIIAAMVETNPEALLQIALVLDDKARLAHVIELAGPERLQAIGAAAESAGLSAQLQALSVYLTPEQQARLPT